MEIFQITDNVKFATLGIFAFLTLASLFVAGKIILNPEKDYRDLYLKIRSWWVMVIVFAAGILVNKITALCLIGFISFLALKEYLSLIPTRRADRRVLFWAYLAIPIQLYFIATNWLAMFYLFIPVYMFLMIPFRMVTIGETEGYLKAAGTIQWGLMATVFSLGHLAALSVLPIKNNPVAGGIGLLIFLILLNSLNDAAQFCTGKLFGRNKIIPKVSPNKTWEGFIGGVIITTLLAFVLAPYLTPHNHLQAIIAGLIISIGGFVGDVTVSALKRDLGIKDSGSLIPGHGGILDRVDSLIYTAPLFYHYTVYLHYKGIL